MSEIEMITPESPVQLEQLIKGWDDGQLMAQDLVQQGAVHSISFLLTKNCEESVAIDMLTSLRKNAEIIRAEAARRGKPSMFRADATYFN